MMIKSLLPTLLRILPIFLPFLLSAQLTAWSNKLIVEVENNSAVEKVDFTALLTIDTESLVNSGAMHSAGDDIRIATDCDGVDVVPHFIESGIGTTTTKIWCLLSSIPANGATTVYLFYGNAAAASTSDFDLAFPNQLIIETTDTIQGLITDSVWAFNYIRIDEDVLVKFDPTLTLPWQMRMDASKIEINGTLNGAEMGFPGVVNGAGAGPGGGTMEDTGGGGGAYGGRGGNGGGHTPEAGGRGGNPYGTIDGKDINAGSGGGAAGLAGGGNPGAAGGIQLQIACIDLIINGALKANGGDGFDTEAGYSPGAGSGGGVLIETHHFSGNGTVDVSGGFGGSSPALYYPGGGASGGRIKIFFSGNNNFSGELDIDEGLAGLGGLVPAEDGASGTLHEEATTPLINAQILEVSSALNVLSPLCKDTDILIEAETGAPSYSFFVNDTEVQTGTSNQYVLNTSENLNEVYCLVQLGACEIATPVLNLQLNDLPTARVSSASGLDGFCDGSTIDLVASTSANSEFKWFFEGGNLNQDNQNVITVNQVGAYSLEVSDNFGCINTSTDFDISVFETPETNIDLTTTDFCEGDSVLISANIVGSNQANWFKDGSAILQNENIWIKEPGNYAGQFQSPQGCIGDMVTFTISENAAPNATVNYAGGVFICENVDNTVSLDGITDEAIQWFNGENMLVDETNSSLVTENSGSFTATITSGDGCSITTEAIDLVVFPNATATAVAEVSFCEGESTLIEGNDEDPSISYQWFADNAAIDGETNQQLEYSASGSITLVISHEAGCVATSEPVDVTVFPLPFTRITYDGTTGICEDNPATLTTDSEDLTVSWIHDDIAFSSDAAVETKGSGAYWAMVIDENGCVNNTDTLVFEVFPTPETPEISQNTDSLIASTDAAIYQWYLNGALIENETDFFIFPVETGTYQVIVQDENGCISEISEEFNYEAVGIFTRSKAPSFRVFPNPTHGLVQIEGVTQQAPVVVTNISGKQVLAVVATATIDLSSLRTGLYYISIEGYAPARVMVQH